MLILSTLVAIVLYSVASFQQWQTLRNQENILWSKFSQLGWFAVAVHGFAVYLTLHSAEGIHLGFFSAGSLVAWLVALMVLISSLRLPLHNLFIGVFPIASLSALAAIMMPETGSARHYPAGMVAHILLSVLAYSVFTLSLLQAILLGLQERALKKHQRNRWTRSLPPLQTMETFLFQMLWCGLLLLSFALLTGFIFVEDLFAQHLAHKTVFSLLAWCLYATLLVGRLTFGWRSQTAIRWTIGGFVFLAMGFFGSKFVIETLL